MKRASIHIESDVWKAIQAGRVDGNSYHCGGMSDDLRAKVNILLEQMGFRWDEKLQLHVTDDGLLAYKLKEAMAHLAV